MYLILAITFGNSTKMYCIFGKSHLGGTFYPINLSLFNFWCCGPVTRINIVKIFHKCFIEIFLHFKFSLLSIMDENLLMAKISRCMLVSYGVCVCVCVCVFYCYYAI